MFTCCNYNKKYLQVLVFYLVETRLEHEQYLPILCYDVLAPVHPTAFCKVLLRLQWKSNKQHMKKLLLHEQYNSDPRFSSTEKWSLVSLNRPDVRCNRLICTKLRLERVGERMIVAGLTETGISWVVLKIYTHNIAFSKDF